MRILNSMFERSGPTRLTRSVLAFSMAGVCALGWSLTKSVEAQPASDPVIYLDQAWSQADRDSYYNTSQGSAVMEYAVFINLELAGQPGTVPVQHQ